MDTQTNILVRPLVTEKMLHKQETDNQYGFVVDVKANKIDIKRAVEKKFDVAVVNVRTILVKGKTKKNQTRRGITEGKRKDWKKAIVTLREDDSIDFFETS
ncbi:MAG: 50S ribosomal protein L23 [candidate division KSB1 bacterium]|nr:50S ribosomal protein L23 [candidate division KSB1 bacterium]